ncbi:adenosine deaminase [Salinisphaera dokdonensis CL-ES53]|uniref:Adenosine deaminase n=1 Tax=Salinisphaera dokdonensis CL-ES53 TaxID=1304272 RepID=A0ABV2B5C6_9GAMM
MNENSEQGNTVDAATQAARWRAVVDDDAAADGSFVYAVRTTGIYCRPSCRSRLPRRKNVVFHASAEDAEQAGYRPCKRCRPSERSGAQADIARVVRACRLIETSETIPALDDIAAAAGVSAYHFQRLFKRATGLTPHQYARAWREGRLREALESGAPVTDALFAAGYSSSGHFSGNADRALGMPARAYRAGGADESIRFAVGECTLGSVLVAGTERGVCAITLGDTPEPLVEALQARFPHAELIGADTLFERHVAQVIGFVETPTAGLDLPLDIQGTVFQQRVWQALCAIPVGETASYAEIARRIDAPKAVRAVAGVCGANHLALAIPCHRVVRTDGSLSGYRWGVERKRAILAREGSR